MTSRPRQVKSSRDAVETMQRLEGIVGSAMDAIITINDQQRIVLFNPAAERMFGLPASKALNEHITLFIPERFRSGHAAHIARFGETGVTNRQMGSLGAINGMRADRSEFPIEASISQVVVGHERLLTVILRDITERRASEEALLESRMRMEGIVGSAMDALITVDADQRIVLFNPAAERMFGASATEAVGASLLRFIPERFRADHGQHIRKFKETGVTNRRMGALGAISGLRANGEEFPLEASISQVEVGGVKIATVILRDITERQANEEARHLLAREVDHRAKNALAVVQALVSMTKAPTKELFIAAVRGRVAALGRAHSLLAQNRWEGGDLGQIIAEEVSAYERPGQIGAVGPTVNLRPNAVQPVSLLIHELATNAVKYGSLSVERGRVEVAWLVRPDGQLELNWTETCGPSPQRRDAEGFGTTLVREVVTRQLAGTLEINWPVAGLQFKATLPPKTFRVEAANPTRGVEGALGDARPAQVAGRVLIVEDEALIAMELSGDLSALGWEIVGPAATIEEARRLIEDALPDIAVLDVNLSGELVYPLAEFLAASGVPFVFCTGYEDLQDAEQFRAVPVVRKPVSVPVLNGHLRRAREAA